MGADYDRLFQPPEGLEIPDGMAQADFDVNQPSPTPPVPMSPPRPNGPAPSPMPVDWTEQPAQARAEPRPAPMSIDGPVKPPPGPMPVGRPAKPPPTPMPINGPPKPSPVRVEQPPPSPPGPKAPAQRARHARRAHHVPNNPEYSPPAGPQHTRRANPQPGNSTASAGPSIPFRPRVDASALAPGRTPAEPREQRQHSVGAVVKKSVPKIVPQRGWRRTIHTLTRINLGLSRDEKYELELNTRICRRIRGSYQIGVLGLKGGAGKTAVTVALGSVFAQVRGDRILAIDADPASGNLADRVGRQSAATVADLLANEALSHYNDIRAHTSINAANLEVLSAAEYSTARRTLNEEEWRRTVAVVPRYYNLVLADCGPDLFGPATRGVLLAASGLVIVSSASIDSARQAAVAIDWLRHNGYLALLHRACVVINHVAPGETNIAVGGLVGQFEQLVQPGRLIVLPWDKHVAAGTEIQIDLLGDTYRHRIAELAAALSDDFDRSERR
jgi:MinD-like ATPase involved in chromosome partitioning or flagellar assembly